MPSDEGTKATAFTPFLARLCIELKARKSDPFDPEMHLTAARSFFSKMKRREQSRVAAAWDTSLGSVNQSVASGESIVVEQLNSVASELVGSSSKREIRSPTYKQNFAARSERK